MKEIETTGEFWSPAKPARRFWGTLKFRPGEGVILWLNGNFEPRPFPGRGMDVPVLNGRLFNGAPCTILDGFCQVETFLTESGHHFRSEIAARQMVLGLELGNADDHEFSGMSIRFSHLDEWFDNPLTIDFPNRSFEDASIKWLPDSFDASVDIDGVITRIQSFCSRSIPTIASREGATWAYNYKINIQSEELHSLEWFMKAASSLRRFFIFMTGTGIYTLDCSMFAAPGGDRHQALPVYIPVAIPAVVRPEPRYFSTRHQAVRGVLPDLLASWFSKELQLSAVVNSYTDALLLDGTSPDSIFLRTVQTLEHFHGLLWPEESLYVAKPVWKKFLRWFKSSFPAELPEVAERDMLGLSSVKDIVVNRVAWLNNSSFRTRMLQLFRSMPGRELMPVLGNPANLESHLDQFILRLEATRHYLTHFSDKQRRLSFTADELEAVTLQCWAVLTFWLARFLELNEELAGDMALQASKAMFLVGLKERL